MAVNIVRTLQVLMLGSLLLLIAATIAGGFVAATLLWAYHDPVISATMAAWGVAGIAAATILVSLILGALAFWLWRSIRQRGGARASGEYARGRREQHV